MLKKTVFAAATIAVSMIAFQPAAQAGNIQVQVHFGGGWHDGHYGGHWDDHWGGPWKLSCYQGKRKLRRNGYHHINAFDCHGKYLQVPRCPPRQGLPDPHERLHRTLLQAVYRLRLITIQ